MKQYCQTAYLQLQAAIGRCLEQDIPELEKVESCFRTATGCWVKVREELLHYRFATEDEEIDFFKHIKPLFTSQIERFTLIYQAILFKPKEDLCKIISFWAGESGRLQRFSENKSFFIRYYKEGDTHLDREYFLRLNNQSASGTVSGKYDKNNRFSTSHDGLVAALLAQEMYQQYVKDRLRELK